MSVTPIAAANFKPQAASANASAATSSFLDALKAQNAGSKVPGGAAASQVASAEHRRHHHGAHHVASVNTANGQTTSI